MDTRILPGGVPEPEELIGRQHLIQCIWHQLSGNNILLVAPRRFGKTGIMRHMLKRPVTGYVPVYVEVEDISQPEEFAAQLLATLLERDMLRGLLCKAKSFPRKIMDSVTDRIEEIKTDAFGVKLREAIGDSWESTVKALVLEMEKAKETVVFLIDEFPQCVDNIARVKGEEPAKHFLSWFRSLRMKQKDDLRRLRFVLGGSTGIDMILRRLDVPDKLNDLARVPVDPLTPEAAEELLHALGEKYGLRFAPDACERFFGLIGRPVPYFIHLLVSQILLEERLARKEVSGDDVEDVYHKRLLGPTCRAYFDYYRRRLKRYGSAGEKAAVAVLSEIAQSSTGRASNSALYDVYRKARGKGASGLEFDEIMADLESDWYVLLDTATNEYFFLMDVMKAWWKRFYRTSAVRRR